MIHKKNYTVLITRNINFDAIKKLESIFNLIVNDKERPLSKSELKAKVKGINGIICFLNDIIDKDIMDAAGPSLKIISTFSTGFEHIDLNEAKKRGILIGYTGNILTETTADLAFGMMLSFARRIIEANKYIKDLKWQFGWCPDLMLGVDIHSKTIGIIGMGNIGSAIARRALSFNMNILYTKRTNYESKKKPYRKMRFCSLDELLSESDFVVICCSLNKDSYHMLDYKRLKSMKKSAYLINIARGQIINENDLIKILKDSEISGAALDVFENEPPRKNNPLLKLKNVLILPHIGSASIETRTKMAEISVNNIISVLNGNSKHALLLQ